MPSRLRHKARRYSRGAALAELLYVLPLFFFLLFGIMEAAFIFRTRATLNVATFQAARLGATQHAMVEPMRDRLARGMVPLYMKGKTDPARYAAASLKSKALAQGVRVVRDPVRVISPRLAVFEAFREQRSIRLAGSSSPSKQMVIPNDNLKWRNPKSKIVAIDGENRELSIQDANLLKIATFWCHRLKVPVLDRIIHGVTSGLGGLPNSTEQAACNAYGLAGGGYYLAITSHAVVHMQSDVVSRNNNLN